MDSELVSKIKQLPPAVRAELEKEEFLSKVDAVSKQYGVKGILILLKVVFGELSEANLVSYLMTEYDLNEFLAGEIKSRIISLAKNLPQVSVPAAAALKRPASVASPMTFSREDEEEIKKFKTAPASPAIDYPAVAEQIIVASGVSGLDDVLTKRFNNIIVSRLRDVRDDLETAEILTKDRKVGGLGFTEAQSDALLKLIRTGKTDQPLGAAAVSAPSAKVPANLPIDLDFGDEENEETESENLPAELPEHDLLVIEDEDGLPVLKMPTTTAAPKPSSAQEPPQKLSEAPQNVKMNTRTDNAANPLSRRGFVETVSQAQTVGQPIKPEKTLPPPQPAPFVSEKKIPESVLATRQERRPNLDGVKFDKKLVGPIDELANMTLIDFRRLAADPKAATAKVKEKIELLGQDGFTQKMAGIAAWHDNEVNKFYRLLGQASMAEGRPIEEIIKERLLASKPTLSVDELEAIIELNRTLRF